MHQGYRSSGLAAASREGQPVPEPEKSAAAAAVRGRPPRPTRKAGRSARKTAPSQRGGEEAMPAIASRLDVCSSCSLSPVASAGGDRPRARSAAPWRLPSEEREEDELLLESVASAKWCVKGTSAGTRREPALPAGRRGARSGARSAPGRGAPPCSLSGSRSAPVGSRRRCSPARRGRPGASCARCRTPRRARAQLAPPGVAVVARLDENVGREGYEPGRDRPDVEVVDVDDPVHA